MSNTENIRGMSPTPRITYAKKRNTTPRSVLAIGTVAILLSLFFIIISTTFIAKATSDTGIITHQESYKTSKRTIYTTVVEYKGELINSDDMRYTSVSGTGGVGESIDLLVDDKGNVAIAKAVNESRKMAIGILLLSIGILTAIVLAFNKFHKALIKKPFFSDAKAITIMYSPEKWQKTFPRLANQINPETGNIEVNYIPQQSETFAGQQERFATTMNKYSRKGF